MGVRAVRNDELSALLEAAATEEPTAHRRQALDRAAKEAWRWPEEAAALLAAGRPLTELRSVGPWVAEHLERWITEPPETVPALDVTRRGFLTTAQVNEILAIDPTWEGTPHADLQLHTTGSDGRATLDEMVAAARDAGRTAIRVPQCDCGEPTLGTPRHYHLPADTPANLDPVLMQFDFGFWRALRVGIPVRYRAAYRAR